MKTINGLGQNAILRRTMKYSAPPQRDRNAFFRRMTPEERVNLALELTSSITTIALEGLKSRNPGLSTAQLHEKARQLFQKGRRTR